MIKKAFWIFLLMLFFAYLTHDRLIGLALQFPLESKLTDLFGMPVTIKGLRVRPLAGKVTAARVTFLNQPEFEAGPHLDVQGIDFDIDF